MNPSHCVEGFVFEKNKMNKKSFPPSLVFFVLTILAFQIIALSFSWYWRIWWFDMPMHFAGGLWIGLSVLWIVFLSERFIHTLPQNTLNTFFIGILSVCAVAIAWEIFEYIVYILFPHGSPYDIFDTMSDIFLGLMGGVIASLSFSWKRYFS